MANYYTSTGEETINIRKELLDIYMLLDRILKREEKLAHIVTALMALMKEAKKNG